MDVLLVDDDPIMHVIVQQILEQATGGVCKMIKATEWLEAARHANSRKFDLILLDNLLSRSITAQVSVPLIRKSRHRSPIAIISSDIRVDYLSHPSILGVDYIVDKMHLARFLRDQARLLSILQ
ncbi:MAG: response regulator [Litorimonas sp.]